MFFFFNDTSTTEIYTLSLHDALPISYCNEDLREARKGESTFMNWDIFRAYDIRGVYPDDIDESAYRSEEHTSELQSQSNLVCRLLLEKKKTTEMTTQKTRRSLSILPI